MRGVRVCVVVTVIPHLDPSLHGGGEFPSAVGVGGELVEGRRGGGEEHRLAAVESLAAATDGDAPLVAQARELVGSLKKRKKAIPLYNQTVQLFNAR